MVVVVVGMYVFMEITSLVLTINGIKIFYCQLLIVMAQSHQKLVLIISPQLNIDQSDSLFIIKLSLHTRITSFKFSASKCWPFLIIVLHTLCVGIKNYNL